MEPDLVTQTWFDGYFLEIFPAKRRGYSGTGLMYRSNLKPIEISHGMGAEEFDDEGRVMSAIFDQFELVNVYAPHSHRELKNLEKKLRFADAILRFIAEKCAKAAGKPIILSGDLNVAAEERDVFHHRTNHGNACFHDLERAWFQRLLRLGMIDALREITPEAGVYSWWSQLPGVKMKNIGWRLDYFLVCKALQNNILDCYHSPKAVGSDHCPVSVKLKM